MLHEYLIQTDTEYPLLKLTPISAPVLKGQERLIMKLVKEESHVIQPKTHVEAMQDALLPKLKILRSELAKEQNIPAYMIFTDATLIDICRKMPVTEDDFLKISGVGKTKLERYGTPYLEVIRNYLSKGLIEKAREAARSKIITLKQDFPLDMFVSLLNKVLSTYGYKSSEDLVIQYFMKCEILKQLSKITFDVTEKGELLGVFAISDENKTLVFLEPQTLEFLVKNLESIVINI